MNPETLGALKEALLRCLDGDGDVERVRPALRRVATEARERHVYAEQLLITLKDIWYGLPQVRQTEDDAQQRVLQNLVTTCIREYYATEGD